MALNFNSCGQGGGGETYAAGAGIQISAQNEISADVREHEIAKTEETSTASEPHAVGEYFILYNRLYKVTAAIAIDDEIVEGTNVVETSVGKVLASPYLLWENPHPNASFARQTVALDLKEFRFVDVYTSTDQTFARVPVGGQTNLLFAGPSANSTYGVYAAIRQATATEAGVIFSDAQFGHTGAGSSIQNTHLIPSRIYGVL